MEIIRSMIEGADLLPRAGDLPKRNAGLELSRPASLNNSAHFLVFRRGVGIEFVLVRTLVVSGGCLILVLRPERFLLPIGMRGRARVGMSGYGA
jgi:hypothetical protein